MSILTFNEACSFVTEIALSEKLYESETSCIFVEIDPTAGLMILIDSVVSSIITIQ